VNRAVIEPVLSWSAIVQPVPLHRARSSVRGGVRMVHHLTDSDYAFRDELRMLWKLAGFGRRPLEGDLVVRMIFAGSSARGRSKRPDITNLLKAVEDAGNPQDGWRGLWQDDAQIREITGRVAAWGRDVNPRIDIDVWRFAE
jgi:Holliday junction resolvase RusA-like endonuclease